MTGPPEDSVRVSVLAGSAAGGVCVWAIEDEVIRMSPPRPKARVRIKVRMKIGPRVSVSEREKLGTSMGATATGGLQQGKNGAIYRAIST